jgi:hypothetical protein
MAVFCGMFDTCKVQISNLLSNCKQIIEIFLKRIDYCFFSFAKLRKHVERCCLVYAETCMVGKTCARRQETELDGEGGGGMIASRNTMKVLQLSVNSWPVGPECRPHLMRHLLLAVVRKVMKFY